MRHLRLTVRSVSRDKPRPMAEVAITTVTTKTKNASVCTRPLPLGRDVITNATSSGKSHLFAAQSVGGGGLRDTKCGAEENGTGTSLRGDSGKRRGVGTGSYLGNLDAFTYRCLHRTYNLPG